MKTFDEMYEELHGSDNNELNIAWEEAKREAKKSNKIALLVCLIVDIILIQFCFRPFLQGIGTLKMMGLFYVLVPILVVDLIIYVITKAIFSKKTSAYNKLYKDKVIRKLMSNFYNGLEYFPEKPMPKNIYDEGDYSEYYNRYSSEDYFEALLNEECGIQMAEVETKKVETHRDSDGRTRTTTTVIFNGLFAKIVMEKSINSKLKVMENGEMFLQKNQLKMDSSEFEKYFDVQASNKIIGMQLLTADVMDELINFQNKTNIKYDISINNNNLYLRFHCGDMFEPGNIKNGALDQKTLEKYFYMLNFTYNLSNKLIKLVKDTEI